MSEEKKDEFYVYMNYHGAAEAIVTRSLDEALDYAKEVAVMYIDDHTSNRPVEVTEDMKRGIAVKVFKVGESIDLPYQKWADEWSADVDKWEEEDKEREYKLYLDLHEKYGKKR